MGKQNCWEFKECGREPGGREVGHLGVCPAATSGEGNELNNGKHRGRICWAVSGTFCGGKIQGTYAQKEVTCLECPFFSKVEEEEGMSPQPLLDGQEYTPRYQDKKESKKKK